ncbi:alpha/beta hydrolase family protein [Pseudodesulfovibrio sediminis]|uniref:Dienelactone hydrolase n=1 Tax=Pseudodesulfovibrio sediminis TaxID=2810563 RepID=A0ABM7P8W2_9BACT|nr:hypothetical protein [Pseudodesulfovibrio sediminis]BCS89433.1 dienelactone hydrolase [Pseudodesulfovibrio sediminis]
MKAIYVLVLLIACAASSAAGQPPGFTHLNSTTIQGRALELSIWYPVEDGILEAVEVGGNAVFMGAKAALDVPFSGGTYPLVLVKHGGLRSANDSGSWLCAPLARVGFIVVEINGQRPDNAASATNEIWQRPNDISRALDLLTALPKWAEHIDRSKIFVVGFALGGTAALAISGGQFDVQRYIHSCDDGNIHGPDCAWYAAQNVPLSQVDQKQLAVPRHDPRIAAAVTINPEYTKTFVDGAAAIDIPTLLIYLGNKGQPNDVIRGPSIQEVTVPAANIFDGFSICTGDGSKILFAEGGDPRICGTSEKTRESIHRWVVGKIKAFLGADGATAQ